MIEMLPYNDLKNRYASLEKLPGFSLLQSSDRKKGRYDILSALPYRTFSFTINEAEHVFPTLKKTLPCHKKSIAENIPFQGGAIGFFSYDLACHLMGIPTLPKTTEYPLPIAEFSLYHSGIVVDHALKKVSLISPNGPSETTKALLSAWKKPEINTASFAIKSALKPLITREQAENSFLRIIEALTKGRCYQVNYTQPFELAYEGDDFSMYQKICEKNPVPYAAFLRTKHQAILSFSPERFILGEKDYLLTSPIKGTAKRFDTEPNDTNSAKALQECPKNRAENVMIVDLMRHDFGKIAKPGSVKVKNLCKIESFPKVHHLVSDIEATLKSGYLPWDVLKACIPGGSITGAPKIEAMRLISEEERFSRGVYCGNIGYISNHGRFDMNIAIRTAVTEGTKLSVSAGGAILLDSIFNNEYDECYIKLSGFLSGLF